MSNVLIGIIGVILFIGLALAGALFLGPRFQESTNNSKAAASVQAISQVQNAIDLYKAQEGTNFDPSYYPSNLEGTYLKSVPSMPGGASALIFVTTSVGADNVLILRSNLPTTGGTSSKSICEAILKQTVGSTTIPTEPVSRIGCYNNGVRYVAYGRVDIQ